MQSALAGKDAATAILLVRMMVEKSAAMLLVAGEGNSS